VFSRRKIGVYGQLRGWSEMQGSGLIHGRQETHIFSEATNVEEISACDEAKGRCRSSGFQRGMANKQLIKMYVATRLETVREAAPIAITARVIGNMEIQRGRAR
jgi:hypothetical protein